MEDKTLSQWSKFGPNTATLEQTWKKRLCSTGCEQKQWGCFSLFLNTLDKSLRNAIPKQDL